MERGRSLLIFNVKGHISRPLGLYKEFWHYDPCRQDIVRTIWPRMLKLSVYTLYGQSKKPIYFQVKGQILRAFTKNSGTWIPVGRI